MSLEEQLAENRQRITTIEAEQRAARSPQPVTELPDGFYTPAQLERFQEVDTLLVKTTAEFMQEAGIYGVTIGRDFRTLRFGAAAGRWLSYSINFPGFLPEASKPSVCLRTCGEGYTVGLDYESFAEGHSLTLLATSQVPLLIPWWLDKRSEFDLTEVRTPPNTPDRLVVRLGNVRTRHITKDSVHDFLALIASDPRLIPLLASQTQDQQG